MHCYCLICTNFKRIFDFVSKKYTFFRSNVAFGCLSKYGRADPQFLAHFEALASIHNGWLGWTGSRISNP